MTTMTTNVQQEFAEYRAKLAEAQAMLDRMRRRRVRYTPFGRPTEHVGTVTGVAGTGLRVRWDDERAFWDGSKPHALHPGDLTWLS